MRIDEASHFPLSPLPGATVLAEVAKAWAAAGLGPVVGITASQPARNTLAAVVTESYNSARFLGHLPGRRGARGPSPGAPGTLLVIIDEASMMTGPDLADLITLAEKHGGSARSARACRSHDRIMGDAPLPESAEKHRFRHPAQAKYPPERQPSCLAERLVAVPK